MSTIPAEEVVKVIPGVLAAGGNALDLNGMFLTQSPRVPVGIIEDFADEPSVGGFFGLASPEAAAADIYFNGFDNSTQKPGSMKFVQYNQAAVPAYLQGGQVNVLTLQQLQALTGSLTVIMDGLTYTNASFNLAAATSFTAAAALIAAALNTAIPTAASVTGTIAPGASSFTASIAGNVMYVTGLTSGLIVPGTRVAGAGVAAGTKVTSQLSGATNGTGTYAVNNAQVVPSGNLTGSYGTFTVATVVSGTITPGQVIAGAGITVGTTVTGYGTGQGLTGTYFVDITQTVTPAEAITASGQALAVTFDSTSGGFKISSGSTGAVSTSTYATGTLAIPLRFTLATGAVTSQGADAAIPGPFMDALTDINQNWASFLTLFDPDDGVGNTQKVAFGTWVNGKQDRYLYSCWDGDVSPETVVPATSSLGQIFKSGNFSGIALTWQPAGQYDKAVFLCGAIASVDFEAVNGRATFKFRSQTGLTADVTNRTKYRNLVANGYNCYAVFGTANQDFLFYTDGIVSGPFRWIDSYINQIWLNSQFQLAFMLLLIAVKSIPYNRDGYNLIEAAAMDPINQGLKFGAFRAGVTMSQAQIAEVNNSAGIRISDVLTQRGWYLQVIDASPAVRQERESPPCNFWYMDGQSVQKITINSVDVL